MLVWGGRVGASAGGWLAGERQDQARAGPVGGAQTYGKGTVQNVVDRSDYVSKELRKLVGGARWEKGERRYSGEGWGIV